MLPKRKNELGIVSPVLLLLIAVVGILGYLIVSSSFPFKDQMLGLLFPKQSSHAAGAVDLSIIPANISVGQNKTFLVDVAIDAKTDEPTAAQFSIKFDPTILQANKVEPGYFFNTSDAFGPPQIDNTNGIVAGIFTQGALPKGCHILNPDSCYFEYKSGYGSVATIEFRSLVPTSPTTEIRFDTTNGKTQIASLNKTGDQLGLANSSIVTVNSTANVVTSAQFSLAPATGAVAGTGEVPVQVKVLNPTDSANLFSARINYNASLLEISRIDTTGSFITQWVSEANSFDNATGRATIIGAAPNPGYKTAATPELLATIYFKSKAGGSADVSFDGTSAVYRNSDNNNILASSTGGTYTVSAPVVVTPTPAPTVAPTATPAPSTAATATPIATVLPTPTPAPTGCTISNATWVAGANPISEKSLVTLLVTATGDCTNSQVAFDIFEDDGVLGNDPVTNKPVVPVKFNTSNQARASWLAEFQEDGLLGINNPPEYYFTAQLAGSSTSVRSADPVLTVNKLGAGGVLLRGDANKDQKLDLVDLSILLSNWDKTEGFADELDTNNDGEINTADYSNMIIDLKANGTIYIPL